MPAEGIFAPQIPTALNVFNGVDASGTWTLIVDDDLVGFTGTLQQWSLKITY